MDVRTKSQKSSLVMQIFDMSLNAPERIGSFCFSFYFLSALRGMWDLSSPTRDRTHAPCSGSLVS